MLGLHCCAGFSLVVVSVCVCVCVCGAYSLIVVCQLLIAVASLVLEHNLQDTWASAVAAPGL